MSMIKVMIYGQLEDITGSPEISIIEVNNTDMLKEYLFKQYPLLKHKKFLVAINKQVVTETTTIDNNAEIALLPPFSGG